MENDVKKALKEAKEHVKNKDYTSALESCKVVLKQDKSHYLGWVLSAVSFQELGQSDKALTAFTKATELQPEQLTAWQGLAAFLEQERSKLVVTTDGGQQSQELAEKLCAVYIKLESLFHSDAVKLLNILKKQFELYATLGQISKCEAKATALIQNHDKEVIKFVARILCPILPKLSHNLVLELESSLKEVASTEQQDILLKEQYLGVVLTLKQYQKAVNVATDILGIEPNHLISMETVCVAYVNEKDVPISLEKIDDIVNRLLLVNPSNGHGLLAKAKWLLSAEKPLEAKQLLELLDKKSSTHTSLSLLCDAYQQLHHWSMMEVLCRKALESTTTMENEGFSWKLRLSKSLLGKGGDADLKEASTLLLEAKAENPSSSSLKLLEATYFLRTGQYEKCKDILDLIESDHAQDHSGEFLALKAEYLSKVKPDEEAIQMLHSICEEHPKNVELLLTAAKMLWNKPEQLQKSATILLDVIKINRDIAEPYILLGTFYGSQQQSPSSIQRAIRCLEKAFELDPYQVGTSEKLLELYRLIDDTNKALKLLEVIVQSNMSNRRWAWLQKGLLHLKMFQKEKQVFEKEKEAGRAIMCLQNAVTLNPDDSSCWEALGDAYAARGSYSAALKAFQRAFQLNEKSIYSSYQIASLKQIMGEYSEAVVAFEVLLHQTQDYVPALKGLAETVLNQATDYQTDGFTGRVVDCCSRALELLVKASRLSPHLSCIWSLMGSVCLLLRSIPDEDFALLRLPELLLPEPGSAVNKKLVMELGPQFYLSALRILPDSGSLWHNLALSYQACWKLEGIASHQSSALAAVKKAITLEPKEASHWDLLGLISNQPAVQQHAFIRALELSPNSPRAAATWSHLGALYFEHGDVHLAHECFKQSQNIDPFHVAAWIGQGNVAERLSPSEAMDLFRHTAAIGSGCPGQCEGAPSYAQWVISTLADPLAKQTAHYRYSIVQMHAVPAAIDCLVKYIALYPDDSCALNLLGLLYERQGLLTKAEEAFLRGINCLSEDDSASSRSHGDKVRVNLARLYTSMNRCDEATELYSSLQESELISVCGVALNHFKANRHAEAYYTYKTACSWMESDDEKLSHLLVAMAMSAFRSDFPDAENAKSLLYQSSQLQPPSVYGLLALGALGLLTEDEILTAAAFQELLPYQAEPRYVTDISLLSSYQQLVSGCQLQGQREIARNLHMLPNVSEMWTLLATFKATVTVQASHHQEFDGLQVARWAEIAFDARRQDESAVDHIFQPMNLSEVISLISWGYLLAADGKISLITAQKAVHCNPHSAASWSVLLASAFPFWSKSTSDPERIYRLSWLKKLIEHLRRKCDVTAYSGLTPWLGHYERRLVSLLSQG